MTETLGGPDIPDDATLRAMVLTGETGAGEQDVIRLDELAAFDVATAMAGLHEVGDPDGSYRQERDEHQLVLAGGAGQLVLNQYRLGGDQLITDSN